MPANASVLPEGSAVPTVVLAAGVYELPLVDIYVNNSHDIFLPEGGIKTFNADRKTGFLDIEKGLFTEQDIPFTPGDPVYVSVRYPDGFERDHQVSNLEELIGKITKNLRARFVGPNGQGAEIAKVELPAAMTEGSVITITVQ